MRLGPNTSVAVLIPQEARLTRSIAQFALVASVLTREFEPAGRASRSWLSSRSWHSTSRGRGGLRFVAPLLQLPIVACCLNPNRSECSCSGLGGKSALTCVDISRHVGISSHSAYIGSMSDPGISRCLFGTTYTWHFQSPLRVVKY